MAVIISLLGIIFRPSTDYSLPEYTLSALLAAGWLVTTLRVNAARREDSPPLRHVPPKYRGSSEKERKVMEKLHHCVVEQKDYLLPGLTLGNLSEKLGVSSACLSRAVNRNTGRHFCRWLNEIRIMDAVERISDPACTWNFSEIAYGTGFNDRTTFFRAFKQVTGRSPRDFCRSVEKKCCNS